MTSSTGSIPLTIDDWKKIEVPSSVLRIAASVAAHPIEYTKVLIQIGYEPIAPRNSTTIITRKPALVLPSVFQYMGYIRRRDGFLGLYRGLSPRICELGISCFVVDKVAEMWPEDPYKGKSDEELTEEERRERVISEAMKEGAQRLAAIIITQPFHVIAIRAMAQFVGGEDKYTSVFGGIYSIMQENGIAGFWSGLIPRALGELSLVGLSAAVTYMINNYILSEKELKQYTSVIVNFLTASFCYPFQVVSNCIVVSRSGLIAGYPPNMPLYVSWVDCWKHLAKQHQLKRGSTLFRRYYTGPQVIVGDRVMPINPSMFRTKTQ